MKECIYVVEDDENMSDLECYTLTNNGYEVKPLYTAKEFEQELKKRIPDMIILDIMLPGMDGWQILQTLRTAKQTPVICLTARDSVDDRVRGLDSGANDYLVKPFSFEELSARLRAMMRGSFGVTDNVLHIADLSLDCTSHRVMRGGKEITLSAKEYAMLEYFMYNQGRVLSREMIEDHVWNFDYEGGTNIVDVYISYLRKKIDGGYDKKLIHTVRGRGFIMREEI